MTKAEDGQRPPSPEKAAERARLAEALRENLRRRKAQRRGRAATEETGSVSKTEPSQ